MADPAIGFDRGIETPKYSPLASIDRAGDRPARPVQPEGPTGNPEADLVALIRIATAKASAGDDAEATECFRKALEIGDRALGPDNPDLMLLLNDLTRLYLKQSAYADAEPLLLRLLEMKRSKGEDHPEVATVLASLATVRQALGRHESAEQLWRRVLEIREQTLAPNHFAIATALERLADACAARGNIAEALPAYQRALTIRERTLGSGHPSLRTSKERIADLQLQSAEDSFDPTAGAGILPTPEKYRLLSGDHLRLSPPASQSEVRKAPAREMVAPAATRQTRVVVQIPVAEAVTSIPSVRDVPTFLDESVAMVASPSADALPYRDALESIREELEEGDPRPTLSERLSIWSQALTTVLAKRQVVAGIIVGVVSLLLLAVAKEHAWGELDQGAPTVTESSPVATSPTTPTISASALASPVHVTTNIAPAPPSAPKSTAAKSKAEERTSSRRSEEPKPETKKLALPTISSSVLSQLDSVASTAATGAGRSESIALPPVPTRQLQRRATFDVADASAGPQRARLIGALPTPRVPRQAMDVEGVVSVRFSVGPDGKPMTDSFEVVNSPNPLLTSAVRRVIPEMRFEPARVSGAGSRAIADVVQIDFRFTSRPR